MTTPVKASVGPQEKELLLNQIPFLKGKKILIIGDVGLDEYVMGQVRRISPEAPVPVLEVEEEDMRLGLAANVAQNVASLGGEAMLVSVVGDDTGANLLRELFAKSGVSWDYMIVDKARPTTRKTRVMAKHHHLVRVDYELRKYLSAEAEARLIETVEKNVAKADCVVIEDYAKGVISRNVVEKVAAICKKHGKKLMVDPHRNNHGSFYQGVDLIKPNYDEAVVLTGMDFDDLRDNPNKVVDVARALQKLTGAKDVVLTRGKDGMTIVSGDEITEVPTYARKVFDVTGAGDTVIAALSLGLVSGLSLVHSCMLANYAAGVVVGKVGCVPCEIPELKEYIQTAH
ncbi:D-glycero-beta-D-manno-heptose-7-phosphate kinase [Bdellovibrio bacteriovorus]|uniref:ADP-heptose synthase n=1 Tax=Bdellovibrio bacteriovorus (strain ATCC 15356 / DSM 50701 / NCIMB 9529 / HD100) TaxID=264462 RepID=Q6MPW9_BDEBA|nr:D-glycero-beta-D-manno-heptose-7-phosphate kinase [Bdellovibrio bacteriovorus]AHZ86787.1 ADP-heptose synthase [Bdellovibrio bacteriovorus]BEV67227.1 Bifunctional protein HldE [Bdellovibrio bacteriovorus]CAE78678.1 ADP-heptose synthase [Bdellovibrio bacteriovorus HD100]